MGINFYGLEIYGRFNTLPAGGYIFFSDPSTLLLRRKKGCRFNR